MSSFRERCKCLSTLKRSTRHFLATLPGQAQNYGILVDFSLENLVYHRDQFKLRWTESWSLLVYCASEFIEKHQDLCQIILHLSSNFKDSLSFCYLRSLARIYIVYGGKEVKFVSSHCVVESRGSFVGQS